MATKQNGRQSNHKSKKVSHAKAPRNKQTDEVVQSVSSDVILVITLLVSLLFILSYMNLCGPVGKGVNYVMFGLIGLLAYVFPFALFLMVAFLLANRKSHLVRRKLYSSVVFVCTSAALLQLVFGFSKEMKLTDYFIKSANMKTGGGFIGGLLLKPLCTSFGVLASSLILLAILLICILLITGKALIIAFAKRGGKRINEYKERNRIKEVELSQDTKSSRREPRIVSFPKDESKKGTETALEEASGSVIDEDQVSKQQESFLSQLKQMGSNKKVNISEADSIENRERKLSHEMEEIINTTIVEPSITGTYHVTSSLEDSHTSIYEEELKRKFGASDEAEDSNTVTKSSLCTTDTDDISNSKDRKSISDVPFIGINSMTEPIADSNGVQQTVGPLQVKTASATETSSKNTLHTQEPLVISQAAEEKKYIFPSLDLLGKAKSAQKGMTDKDLKETALKLQKTLESFGVRVTISNISCGPAVTRYELQPEQGVKVSKITGLADDIKLNLAAADVRIEAPIPGKAAVGIEVPNKENSPVMLREILSCKEFKEHSSDIAFAVGKDIGGQAVVTDIAKMPHLLIAGATGSGKSVCINTLIMSILYKADPADVRMIMVDPKVVELSVYNGIPHLLIPVVTDPKKASAALNWAVMEMTERYKKFADLSVRDLKGYNDRVAEVADLHDPKYQKLPQIVIIVDELADLMMVAPGEVEDAICRLAQMARAAGLHLIIATQRPSVNVITGLIKANVPSRIAFSVSSAIDSRTIIDGAGAEKLLGKGDMLFFPSGYPKPVRVQGAFVSDKEVSAVVEFLKEQSEGAAYSEEVSNQISNVSTITESTGSSNGSDRDEYFIEAGKFIIEKDKASIGMLQRIYKIGFNRAARIMDQLAEAGVVGPEEGTKSRKVLMSLEEFEQYVDEVV